MSSICVDCPDCGFECKVDEDLAAEPIECPRCKQSFSAEAGGGYGVANPWSSGREASASDSEEPEPEESEGQGGKSWLEAWPQD